MNSFFRNAINAYYKYTATLLRDLPFKYFFLAQEPKKRRHICIITKNLHNGKECIMRSYTSMCALVLLLPLSRRIQFRTAMLMKLTEEDFAWITFRLKCKRPHACCNHYMRLRSIFVCSGNSTRELHWNSRLSITQSMFSNTRQQFPFRHFICTKFVLR